jgi:hypothetical protein
MFKVFSFLLTLRFYVSSVWRFISFILYFSFVFRIFNTIIRYTNN